jgi:hypothetical protein
MSSETTTVAVKLSNVVIKIHLLCRAFVVIQFLLLALQTAMYASSLHVESLKFNGQRF